MIEGWNTMWLGMSNIIPSIEPQKLQEFEVSQSKLISVEKETNYTLNLG